MKNCFLRFFLYFRSRSICTLLQRLLKKIHLSYLRHCYKEAKCADEWIWFCGGQAAAQILHARILLPIHTFHLESSRSFFPHFLHFSWIKNIIISTMQISHHCHFASYEISLSYEFECEDKKHSNIKNAGERGHRRCSSIWLADYSRRHIAHIFSSSIEGREGGSNKETTRYKNNMENVLPITIDYRVKLIFNYFLVLYS